MNISFSKNAKKVTKVVKIASKTENIQRDVRYKGGKENNHSDFMIFQIYKLVYWENIIRNLLTIKEKLKTFKSQF